MPAKVFVTDPGRQIIRTQELPELLSERIKQNKLAEHPVIFEFVRFAVKDTGNEVVDPVEKRERSCWIRKINMQSPMEIKLQCKRNRVRRVALEQLPRFAEHVDDLAFAVNIFG